VSLRKRNEWQLALFPGLAGLELVHRRRHARAPTQRFLQVRWPTVLSQQVAEGLVGKLLKIFHLVAREQVESLPRFVVELDALPFHQTTPSNLSNTAVMISEMRMDPSQPTLLEKKKNI